jgi:hypothetical protein
MTIFLFRNCEGEKEVIEEFDGVRGYKRKYIEAKELFSRQNECIPCDLTNLGHQIFEGLFSRERCSEFSERIEDKSYESVEKMGKETVLSLLDEIFRQGVEKSIISFFQTEFIPTTFALYRTEAGQHNQSGCWHFDPGPEKHLVMLVYLTDSEPDGAGTTIFVNKRTSQQFSKIGYAYLPIDQRQDDEGIKQIAEIRNLEFEPIKLQTKAGDGILFDARHIMHRGFYPRLSPRDTILISLIPSTHNWKIVCENSVAPQNLTDLSYPPMYNEPQSL